MQLLITGGNGLLAREAAKALSGTATVRLLDAAFEGAAAENVETMSGDLRDPALVERALGGVDTVLHLAPLYPTQTENPPFGAESDLLDQATRGTYVLLEAMRQAGIRRLVAGSTLALFDRLPARWNVAEGWRPRPTPELDQLVPWLAELSAREHVRAVPIRAVALRFGTIVTAAEFDAPSADTSRLHVEDAVHSLTRAVAWLARDETPQWRVFHIAAEGAGAKVRLSHSVRQELGYEPVHTLAPSENIQSAENRSDATQTLPEPEVAGPTSRSMAQTREAGPAQQARNGFAWKQTLAPLIPVAARPIQRVVIFGAGGPVAAALAQELASSYTLRLSDVRPLAEIAATARPQTPGAPLPVPLPAPHDERVVDVRDPRAVLAACEGMDAIINCTVVRPDLVEAFRVNTLGAYHIARAAVTHGIRRIVQTGPQMVDMTDWGSYSWEYDIPGDAPPRPGNHLYFHSKYLGQEILRVFAETYGLEVPVLLYCMFYNPEVSTSIIDFSVSWSDSSRAIRRALEVTSLPSPYEVMNILADLPHERYSNTKAKRLLEWQPRDTFESFWNPEPHTEM